MSTSTAVPMASPPRGAPLKTLNVFGGCANPASSTPGPNCRNYLWAFLVILIIWGLLVLIKPGFVRNRDGTVDYQRVFWITLVVAAIIVVGLCILNNR